MEREREVRGRKEMEGRCKRAHLPHIMSRKWAHRHRCRPKERGFGGVSREEGGGGEEKKGEGMVI